MQRPRPIILKLTKKFLFGITPYKFKAPHQQMKLMGNVYSRCLN